MIVRTRFPIVAALFATIAFAGPAFGAAQAAPSNYIRESANVGTLRDGKVICSGHRITIPVVAVAPGAPDTTFEIHGQVNPTLVVPAGVRLRFELANNDAGMDHTLDVTTNTPPYALVPANLPVIAPKHIRSVPGLFAASGMVPARSARHRPLSLRSTAWFRLPPGTYHYVCAMPGHAQKGMYGKLVVRKTGS